MGFLDLIFFEKSEYSNFSKSRKKSAGAQKNGRLEILVKKSNETSMAFRKNLILRRE